MRKNKLRASLMGFTLIEGVVILSILIILVLAALLAYRPMRQKARDAQEKALIASLQLAINTYYAKYNIWYGEVQDKAGCVLNNHPFVLLGDNAPPWKKCVSTNLPDGVNWQWTDITDGTGRVDRYHLFCPHTNPSDVPAGGYYFTYFIEDAIVRPGTIQLQPSSTGHH